MEHSVKFNKVKAYFDGKYWTIDRVRQAVAKNWITAAEFKEITGQDY